MFKKLLPRRSASCWLGSETELELDKYFTVERKLGKGSYAVVYQVRRRADQRSYALKVADVRSLGPLEQADVVNEIRLLASLSHPNLVGFHEAFCDQGKLCIVQELVRAGDLGSLIKKRAASGMHFKEETVWATFLQIVLGLQYLHHNHVLHRDLKPGNLLLTQGGMLKLADLGISQLLDRVFTSTVIGTPHYMPPEMWLHQPYSYSADVWALGCILHELCTLRPLFLASSDAEVRQKVLAGVVPPISARYSQDLHLLVAAMLQQGPANRPTTDDILQTPTAQRHLAELPGELQERCISPALSWERSLARMIQPIRVPQRGEEWDVLNHLMPPPRYASGGGVASALRMKKKSWSTGDLQALAAVAEEGEGAGNTSAAVSRDPSVAGGTAGLAHQPAAKAASAMHKSQSYGSLSAAVELELERSSSSLTRRKSLSVGEPLLYAPGPAASGRSGGGGASSGGGLHLHSRSSHSQPGLGPVAEDVTGETAASPPVSPASSAQGQQQKVAPGGGAADESEEPVDPRRALSFRSKSLSVEDAIEVLAAGHQPSLLVLQRRPRQAGSCPAAAAQPAVRHAALTAILQPAARQAVATAIAQPAPPLPSPAVTAQVKLHQPRTNSAGADADVEKASHLPLQPRAAAGPVGDEHHTAEHGKKKHFWQKGGRK